MSKGSDIFSSVLFLGVLGAGAFFLNFGERPEISETEKRELEKFPKFSAEKYLSGEFAEQLDKYYTDTVPMRDSIVAAAFEAENLRGIPSAPKFYGDVSVISDNDDEYYDTDIEEDTQIMEYTENAASSVTAESYVTPPYSESTLPETSETELLSSSETKAISETVTAPAESSVTPAAPDTVTEAVTSAAQQSTADEEEFKGNINEFLHNGILVNGVKMYGEDAGVMLFGGNKKQGLRYANVINSYKKALGKDVNVYNMVVPTSAEFYLPKKFAKYSGSEKDAIAYIYDNLDESVISVDAYSALQQHSDEYIYFRTDHHWTDRGAYYAYTAFCDAAGIEYPALDEYTEKVKENYVGSLYGYTGDVTLKNSPDTFYYYLPPAKYSAYAWRPSDLAPIGPTSVFHEYASGSNMYGMFIGGDNMLVKITSDSGTGRKLAIFKESYGNALAPYFVNGFDEIYVIDLRYFKKNAVQYLKDMGVTDVLFVNNAFAANTAQFVTYLEKMLTAK